MAKDFWAFSEDLEALPDAVGGAVCMADQAGGTCSALLLGKGMRDRAQEALEMGADRALLFDSALLEPPSEDLYTSCISAVAIARRPEAILIASTRRGREIAPRVAAKLGTGCIADCRSIRLGEDGNFLVERPVYGGNAQAIVVCLGRPIVCTVQKKAFELADRTARPSREIVELDLVPDKRRVTVVGSRPRERSGVNLKDAAVIVSAGRGVKKKEDLALLQSLAEVMGGAMACSRPLSQDLGWLPEDHHVGLSGIDVRPQLYLAVGISGQIQHITGIRGSRIIAAVNKDRNAPIFDSADYGVVGDLYQVVPELIATFKELLKR